MKIFLLILVIIGSSSTTPAQRVDVLTLKTELSRALGPHLTIVKDEMVRQSVINGGRLFWLVTVKPTHTGHYAFKYRYRYNQPLYSHVERQLGMRVGEQGCRRGPLGYGRYSKFCLGDTIIFPILIDRFTEQEFSLVFTDETITDNVYQQTSEPALKDLPNAAAKHLVIVGTSESKSLHRAGGYTLKRSATFEARSPGRLNLSLTSHASPDLPRALLQPGTFPVIVIDRNTPITALISNDNVTGFTVGYDGKEYVSSTGGNDSYLTNLLILQSGDRYTFEYESIIVSARSEFAGEQPQKAAPPKITPLPFSFDKTWSYNEWIVDSLP